MEVDDEARARGAGLVDDARTDDAVVVVVEAAPRDERAPPALRLEVDLELERAGDRRRRR